MGLIQPQQHLQCKGMLHVPKTLQVLSGSGAVTVFRKWCITKSLSMEVVPKNQTHGRSGILNTGNQRAKSQHSVDNLINTKAHFRFYVQ
jgi:hypothetical protein